MAENQIEKIKNETEEQIARVKKAVEQFPVMVDKSTRAKIALSGIKQVTNDDEDTATEKLLVKVRNTFQLVETMRKDITGPLDALKKNLMVPEKMISTTDKDSEFTRVKLLRDKYANDKYLKQKQEEERIEKEKAAKHELSQIESEINKKALNGIVDALYNLDQSVELYLKDISLTNFEEKEKRLKLKPKLKIEVYQAWFDLPFTPQKASVEQIDELREQLQQKHKYDTINAEYVEKATVIMKTYIDKLPAIKKNLIELDELEKQNAEEAQKLRDKQEQEAAAERERKDKELAAEKAANDEKADIESRNKQLDAEFDAQVELQSQEKLKNVRTTKRAVVTCSPDKIAQVFSRVLFACFVHPDFQGYLKTDKAGKALPPDENGIPQYAAWADELLKFYAIHSEMNIEGVEIKEILSTIQKK